MKRNEVDAEDSKDAEEVEVLTMLMMLTLMVVWWLRPEIVPLTSPLGQITSMQSNIPSKLS